MAARWQPGRQVDTGESKNQPATLSAACIAGLILFSARTFLTAARWSGLTRRSVRDMPTV